MKKEEEDVEEEDDINICSGSTLSAGGQSCTVSDMFTSGFDEAYSDGELSNLSVSIQHEPNFLRCGF